MIAPQQFGNYPAFATGSSAVKCQPNQVKYDAGYIPGDVLPAEHLNWFLAGATAGVTALNLGVSSIEQELQTLLSCAGMTPSACASCVDQVYKAMMYQINASAGTKAPTGHASTETTYGVGNATCYGHVKLSDTYDSVLEACAGVAASQYALACVYAIASQGTALGDTAGCPLELTGAAGIAGTASRSDHVHPLPYGIVCDIGSGNSYTMTICGNPGGDYLCLKGRCACKSGSGTHTMDIPVNVDNATSASTATCATCAARVGTVSNMFCIYRASNCDVCICNRCAFTGIPLVNIACRNCQNYADVKDGYAGVRFNCQAAVCISRNTSSFVAWCLPGLRFY